MKKTINYLFVLIAIFVFGYVNVNASQLGMGSPAGGGKLIKPEDIQNSTYIIGTHIFKDVEMTMPMIMMASKTIDGDELDKMIIYRKTFKGEWINAITGESVKLPETFFIQHIDLKALLGSPIINGYFDEQYAGNLKTGQIDVWWFDDVRVGVELWRSEIEDGTYELLTKIDETENGYIEDYIEVEIERGKKYYYKARLYREYAGKTTYSDFSEIVSGSNTNIQIELGNSIIKVQEDGSFELESEIITDITADYEYLYTLYSDYSIWYEEAALGETYEKGEKVIIKNELDQYVNYWVTTDIDEFSDVSNQLTIDSTFELKSEFISETEQGYLYNLYVTQEIGENIVKEVYYRDVASQNDFVKLQDMTENNLNVIVPAGKFYEYKIVLSHTNDTNQSFDLLYSNIVRCSSSLVAPELYLTAQNELLVKNVGLAERFEVYSSDSENGKYRLIKTVDASAMSDGNLGIEVSFGKNYLKVRAVATINDELSYSDFSEIIFYEEIDYQINNLGRDVLGNNVFELQVNKPEDINQVDIYKVDEDDNETLVQTQIIEKDETVIVLVPKGQGGTYKIEFFAQYIDSKELFGTAYEYLEENNSNILIELSGTIKTKEDKNIFNIYIEDVPLDAVDAELYCSETLEGVYVQETNAEFIDDIVTYQMLKGHTKYCKLRFVSDDDSYTEYSNTIKISDTIETPILEKVVVVDDWENDEFYLQITHEQTSQTMYQLYGSNTEDGEYKLIDEFISFPEESSQILWVEREKLTKYYKLRSFVFVDDEEVYSEYSNTVKLGLSSMLKGWAAGPYDESTFMIVVGAFGDGIEVYYSSDDETYIKVDLDTHDDKFTIVIPKDSIAYPTKGATHYYKFKMYIDIAGERFYSDFSETMTINDRTISTILSVDPQGQGEPGTYLYDLYINYEDFLIDKEDEDSGYSIDGWELYLDYTVEGKEYIEVDGINYTMVADHTDFGGVSRPYIWGSGQSYNYIARAYYYDGEEKVYYDWSEVLTIDAEVLGIDEPTE